MQLQVKLDTIQKDNILETMPALMDRAKVSLTWTGRRVMEVEGFEGVVTINAFATKFLASAPFNDPIPEGEAEEDLEKRVAYCALWQRVERLYQDSHDQLDQSSFLRQFSTLAREFRPYCRACAGDPMARIEGWDATIPTNSIFNFTKEDFLRLWPNKEPRGKSYSFYPNRTVVEKWYASEEMVKAYLNQKRCLELEMAMQESS